LALRLKKAEGMPIACRRSWIFRLKEENDSSTQFQLEVTVLTIVLPAVAIPCSKALAADVNDEDIFSERC
jgi:hypothetical protein